VAEAGRLPYLALLGLGALDAAGYSVIAPVTPAIADATGAGPALIGALVASFPAGMLAGFGLAGRAVGRWRPTALLLGALALLALGSLGLVVGGGLPAYFAARLVMGVGSGVLWIAVTFATLERWPGQEYLCMSRIYAAYSAGGLVGPALGAIGGIRSPFLAYLALVVLAVPLALAVGTPPRRRHFEPDRSVLRLPGFWLACVGVLFAVMTLGLIEGVLPLRLADRLRQSQIGWLYVGWGCCWRPARSPPAAWRPGGPWPRVRCWRRPGWRPRARPARCPCSWPGWRWRGSGWAWGRPAPPGSCWRRWCRSGS
jgi:MFS family permease